MLTGLGVRELSVSVPAVAAVKARLRAVSTHATPSALAERALACSTAAEVRGAGAAVTAPAVVTVTANPALDHTVWVPGFRARRGQPRGARAAARPAARASTSPPSLAALGVPRRRRRASSVRDNAGLFETFFAERGIGDRFVRLPGRTRTGIKVIDEHAEATTDINFPGLGVDGAAARRARPSGSRPTPAARAGSCCAAACRRVPRPTCTRRLTGSRQGSRRVGRAGHERRRARGAASPPRPTLVKPNRAELEELVGRAIEDDDALLAAADELQRRRDRHGRRLAGRATARCSSTADGAVLARPPASTVVSTVGAG